MAQPQFTQWAYQAPQGQQGGIVEPNLAKKQIGWQPGEQPPCEWMNWIQYTEYLWQAYVEAKTETIDRTFILPQAVTWDGSTLTFGSALQISFRVKTGEQINQFPAGTLVLADGEVVVLRKDKTNSSPVNLAAGTYGSGLNEGQYDIVAESTLSASLQEYEMVLFRRRGTTLEVPCMSAVYLAGSSFSFGNSLKSSYIENFASSTTWVVNHNLGSAHIVQVTDDNDGLGSVIIPDDIDVQLNTTTITFSVAQAGSVLLLPSQ